MKIAIIGTGISGLTVADSIHQQHDITLYEAAHYVGGHTNTIDVDCDGRTIPVDTGFIVFNDRTYPNFIRLLDRLGVNSQPAPMTFSVRCDHSNLEYRGADLGGLFAQKRNLFRPSFHRLLLDIMKFNRESEKVLEGGDTTATVRDYFSRHNYSTQFYEKYFLPLGSSIWSCPHAVFEQFPIYFIVRFYRHHGLLSLKDRPQWRVLCHGSRSYVKPLTQPFADRIHLNTPVQSVHRKGDRVQVKTAGGSTDFDHVVFACHADQALQILGEQATDQEKEILGAFPYIKNSAVLHYDESLLPRSKKAWAAWNYHIDEEAGETATLTYNMNLLQSIEASRTFCVTLNRNDHIDPNKIIRHIQYAHPAFDARQADMQNRIDDLAGPNRTSYCGAYWGNGFHEDGVVSGLTVVKHLEKQDGNEQLHIRGTGVASTL
ncbi:MAG: FAD-dependent oxidoreductase [Planctomycetota bacterium]|nr:FAD-dependent oxidoreductase [Planctomycetota bacterium]